MTDDQKDLVRLRHMLDAAEEAIAFVGDLSADQLRDDRIRSLAVIKCIEIIGEAASQTSQATRATHPDLPWRYAIGMRNRLIHGYSDIDHEIVHRTVTDDLPSLVAALRSIVTRPGSS